jgi:hypothetical protein
MTALGLDAVLRVKFVHCVWAFAEPAGRHHHIYEVRKFFLDSPRSHQSTASAAAVLIEGNSALTE